MAETTQLRLEDFTDELPEEVVPAFEKLFGVLNPHMNDLGSLLNKRLTFGANIAAVFKDVTVNIPAVDWINVGDAGAPAFANSWVNSGGTDEPAAFRISPDGRVDIKGIVKNGTGVNTTIFTLPPGFRPGYEQDFAVACSTGYSRLRIQSSGTVNAITGSVTWNSLNCSFFASATGGGQEWAGAIQNWRDKNWPVTVKATGDNGEDVVGDVRAVIPIQAFDLSKNVNTISSDTRADGVNVQTGNAIHGVMWEPSGKGQVLLRRIGGLSPGRTYRVTLLIIGG
jgi:hypothetical protein